MRKVLILLKNREIFFVSNLLSLSRFVLLIFIVLFLISGSGYFLYAAIFIVILWLTDILDGYIARKRNEVSEFGKIIDPLADKISVVSITFVLLLKDIIPFWFFAIIAARDFLILTGGLYIKNKYRVILQSNWAGKLTVFIIGFTLLNFILIKGINGIIQQNFFSYHIEKLELYSKVLILISIVMSVFSLVSYFGKFLEIINKK